MQYLAFTRALGDETTRLDCGETALNEARPDNPRNTTTLAVMDANLRALVLSLYVKPESRERFVH